MEAHRELRIRCAERRLGAPKDAVREAAENLIGVYRERYRNATGGFRRNAPMYAEVAALNAALRKPVNPIPPSK